MDAWEPLAMEDLEPLHVLTRFEALGPSERRVFRIPEDFGLHDADNQEAIVGLNRWMLATLREVTPPGGFLHVIDPDFNHVAYRFHPHVPFERGASPEQWWGFVPYLAGAVWRVPVLPDGDSYDFISSGNDFAVLSRYGVGLPSEFTFVGAPLMTALQGELPVLLSRWST